MLKFSYRAFGLNVCSDFEWIDAKSSTGLADVHVRLGRVPEWEYPNSPNIYYQAEHQRLLLAVEGVGRYLISRGNEIRIDPAPSADKSMVLLVLFGPAFGALLHQRGFLVLHGSSVLTPRGAVIFAGASGHGKSTLAAECHKIGCTVVADDVCPVEVCDFPTIRPAIPFLMLWADAARELGLNAMALRRANPCVEKYVVPFGKSFPDEPLPLHAVYVLQRSDSPQIDIRPVRGLAKIRVLNLTCYRPRFIEAMGLETRCSGQISELARRVKVSVVRRPETGARASELAEMLAADWAK